ncbi:hypothetical protein LIPSTDRAFT_108160 [Lipomyces starkeyi NRRL Y-11557]|uniref:Uncharacterized protein n=1 Tax=Lipomyces starkeyi NRRL Y-11557 TaxID=675824 RepID=A0A1E3PUS8_LIPST|nr:hypothetical protein LIPSTDRAFT_108160 [Lipomyces starkeyi NRRL Y-11557]
MHENYGKSQNSLRMESYRRMCRFFSGFFYRHELVTEYDYYWRVEPNTQRYCDITYDPFTFMRGKNNTYGFTITLHEHESTIETLWSTVRNFSRAHPAHIHPNNELDFIVEDQKVSPRAATISAISGQISRLRR